MPSIDDNLELHLALDEVEDGLALDETENDNDGTVNGHTSLVADELFGSCYSFDGVDDYVEVNDPFTSADTFTISIWVRPAALDDGAYHGFVGHQGETRKPGMWLAPAGGGLHYDSYDAAGQRWTDILDNFFTAAGAWVHVAWVKDGGQYSFYRGGEPFATRPAPAQFGKGAAAQYWVGRVDNFWRGQLAHARVYSRALSPDEIRQLMLDDQTASAAFHQTHPVEFSVYDEDEQPVLVVDDGRGGRELSVEVRSGSQRVIELTRPASPTPSADNHHFELKFRPGTLSAASLGAIALEARGGWAMSRAQAVDGTVSLYLLSNDPQGTVVLQPGQSLTLTLLNVSADGAGGARGTRVELRYRQLTFSGEAAEFRGSRVQHLNIVNERGLRNIPLHVGFLGSNTVLNDGRTPNELRLRITNSLSESAIPLAPGPGDAASTFILSFDAQGPGEQKEWAISASDKVAEFVVAAYRLDGGKEVEDTNWHVTPHGLQSKSPSWQVQSTGKAALDPGEMIQLKISNVISSLPSGPTNLYVAYQNLPGYWDGQFVVSAQKSPLVARGNRVGLGTNAPRSEFDTGSGVMTGAANAYQKAQAMMTGGGKVTWGGPGGVLKWTARFIAISFEVSDAIPAGHINIAPPSAAVAAEHVWSGTPRPVTDGGLILYDWEALFAAHRVGGDQNAVDLRIVSYTNYNTGKPAAPFAVPSNWLLVAAVNNDDKSVRLGNGVTLAMNTSSTNGSPIPSGTITMWSGTADKVPGGWALCDGSRGTPDLQDRFVVGATAATALKSGDADQHQHSYDIPPSTFNTTSDGGHVHGFPSWYKRKLSYAAAEQSKYSLIDSNGNDPQSQSTDSAGGHSHRVTVDYAPLNTGAAAAGRPRWFALCYIMKL